MTIVHHLHASLRRASDERGATLVEYTLLVGLIALVCVLMITVLGGAVESRISATGSGF